MEIKMNLTKSPKAKPDWNKLGFGKIFTDHMFVMDWNSEKGFSTLPPPRSSRDGCCPFVPEAGGRVTFSKSDKELGTERDGYLILTGEFIG